jgi:uncharacterized YccA/Bax inhibitor family protein
VESIFIILCEYLLVVRMDKRGLFHIVMGLLRGSLGLSLIVAVLEMFARGPQRKLRSKGMLGILAAMVLSFLLPYAARTIYRAVARPRRA